MIVPNRLSLDTINFDGIYFWTLSFLNDILLLKYLSEIDLYDALIFQAETIAL